MFKSLGVWWRLLTDGFSVDELNRRPAPEVWSALEYALHSAFVLPLLREAIEVMLTRDRARVRDPWPALDIEDATRPQILDPVPLVEDLDREAAAFARLVDTRTTGWDHLGLVDNGTWWQAEATLLHAVHDTTHHLLDVREGLRPPR